MQGISRHGSFAAFLGAILYFVPACAQGQDMVVGVNVVNPCEQAWPIRILSSAQLKSRAGPCHPLRHLERRQGHRFRQTRGGTGHSHPVDRWPAVSAQRADAALPAHRVPRYVGRASALQCRPRALQNSFSASLRQSGCGAAFALAGVELGNEINWAAFNAGSRLPGEGRILGLRGPRPRSRGQADRERLSCSTSRSCGALQRASATAPA